MSLFEMHSQDYPDRCENCRLQSYIQSVGHHRCLRYQPPILNDFYRDDASAKLFEQAGVQLRRYNPTGTFRFPPIADEAFV